MTDPSDIVAIMLAAGLSRRFGAREKLLEPLMGMPIGMHGAKMLKSIDFKAHLAVCSSPEVAEIYRQCGFSIIANAAPELGQSNSLRLALAAAPGATGILVCLADMPFVSRAHILKLCGALSPNLDGRGVASQATGQPMPPALFHAEALRAHTLEGDKGARLLLRSAQPIEAPAKELLDIDTETDLAAARQFHPAPAEADTTSGLSDLATRAIAPSTSDQAG